MSTTATKRSLQQAQADAFAFRALFPGNAWLRWETAGSVRRNCAYVGDVEHVVIPAIGPNPNPAASLFAVEPEQVNLLLHAMDRAVRDGRICHHLYPNCTTRWGARYRGADFRGFCHEVFLAEPRNYGSALAIRTGPADYSRYLVTRLRPIVMFLTMNERRARKRPAYRPRTRDSVRFRYREQYGIIVVCQDESHQKSLYGRLQKQGLACRVVVV